jgi:C4-type Zn-finger protein
MTELSPMIEQVTKNMLRYHVGNAITCPACGDILDCRRAVEMNFSQFDKLVHSGIRCARCFDAMGDVGLSAKRRGMTIEIVDGRVLFATAKRRTVREPATC